MDGMTINHIVSIDHGSYIYIYTHITIIAGLSPNCSNILIISPFPQHFSMIFL